MNIILKIIPIVAGKHSGCFRRKCSDYGLVYPSGDFECLVRHVYKTQQETVIPGTGPEPYVWDENDDSDEDDIIENNNNEPVKEEQNEHDKETCLDDATLYRDRIIEEISKQSKNLK